MQLSALGKACTRITRDGRFGLTAGEAARDPGSAVTGIILNRDTSYLVSEIAGAAPAVVYSSPTCGSARE
jgi:hypothetical protein